MSMFARGGALLLHKFTVLCSALFEGLRTCVGTHWCRLFAVAGVKGIVGRGEVAPRQPPSAAGLLTSTNLPTLPATPSLPLPHRETAKSFFCITPAHCILLKSRMQ